MEKKCSLQHSLTYDNSYFFKLTVFSENQRILSLFQGGGKIAPGGGKIAPAYGTERLGLQQPYSTGKRPAKMTTFSKRDI